MASDSDSPREAAIAPECELQKATDGVDRLESLVSGCLGHSIELKFPAIEIGAGSRVVQALYSFADRRRSVLAWVVSDVEGDRVVALSTIAADNWYPVSLRTERLANETVFVERAEGECGVPTDGVFMPRLEVAAQATRQLLPASPDNCASQIERVWVRRGEVFQVVGAYPLRGRQWLRTEHVREFVGTSSFNGDLVRVADHVTWYWFTGKSGPAESGRGFRLELKAESSSESVRIFRLDHDSLSAAPSDANRTPEPGVPRTAWISTDYGVGEICSEVQHQSRRAP